MLTSSQLHIDPLESNLQDSQTSCGVRAGLTSQAGSGQITKHSLRGKFLNRFDSIRKKRRVGGLVIEAKAMLGPQSPVSISTASCPTRAFACSRHPASWTDWQECRACRGPGCDAGSAWRSASWWGEVARPARSDSPAPQWCRRIALDSNSGYYSILIGFTA